MLGLEQSAITLVSVFCASLAALLVLAWRARDKPGQYRYYRGIDLNQMPKGKLGDKIRWLKEQEPTDKGLKITDTKIANEVVLVYERFNSSK